MEGWTKFGRGTETAFAHRAKMASPKITWKIKWHRFFVWILRWWVIAVTVFGAENSAVTRAEWASVRTIDTLMLSDQIVPITLWLVNHSNFLTVVSLDATFSVTVGKPKRRSWKWRMSCIPCMTRLKFREHRFIVADSPLHDINITSLISTKNLKQFGVENGSKGRFHGILFHCSRSIHPCSRKTKLYE